MGQQELVILSGTAGNGKSYLLSCIHNCLGDKVAFTATTGAATVNLLLILLHPIVSFIFRLNVNPEY